MMTRCNTKSGLLLIMVILLSIPFLLCHFSVGSANEKTVLEVWDSVTPPPPVELNVVKIAPSESAFLVLDIEELTCNPERRPRCLGSVPLIKKFLEKARGKGLSIVYSLTTKGTPETILPDVSPLGTDSIVKSSVDKFYNTDLETILRAKGVKTVIIAGTTAEGAVLHTATGASMRGFRVIVPIDGVSAGTLYAEQYTAWHLLNAPGTRQNTILTRFDMIEF